MAGVVNRMLRTSTTVRSDLSSSPSPSSSSSTSPCHLQSVKYSLEHGRDGFELKNRVETRSHRGRSAVVLMPVPHEKWQLPGQQKDNSNNFITYLQNMFQSIGRFFRPWRNCWVEAIEIIFEKGIIGSQSFALIAVAGSLVGSILCFVEGCFLVLKSLGEHFRFIPSTGIDQALIVKLLVEAIDMFLIGTALLTFGMALYVMFVGSTEFKHRKSHISESNFGSFNLKKLKQGMEKQSVAQAKTKVGHAVLLLLQAGVMEKFTNVPLVSGADLACFSGAILASSASVFLLSRLMVPQNQK
ncbi:hypothetical protein LUZ62_090171 [Rhynchospora pubera]|uniref:Uncharacterized protein n=1 Tax=Rhynchospora pubera TaxID=906938 RepID=A0AAV8CK34_9POAL|nr:hypothetical protein LUZ62_090171 [Rhynchospora pubera]